MCYKNKILSYCEMDEEWNQETAEKSLPLKVDYEIFVGLAVFCIIVLAMSFILGNQENTLINLTLLEPMVKFCVNTQCILGCQQNCVSSCKFV